MTITLGWWLAPLLITLGAFGLLVVKGEKPQDSYGYGRAGAAGVALIQAAGAVIVSLVAWLVYAAAT